MDESLKVTAMVFANYLVGDSSNWNNVGTLFGPCTNNAIRPDWLMAILGDTCQWIVINWPVQWACHWIGLSQFAPTQRLILAPLIRGQMIVIWCRMWWWNVPHTLVKLVCPLDRARSRYY